MDKTHTEPPTYRIVEKVAEREGVDSRQLQPQLSKIIDTEALNTLVASKNQTDATQEEHVRFSYYGYTVTVRFNGQISVEE